MVRFHTSITLDRELLLKIEEYASRRNLSFSRAVEDLIRQGLARVQELENKNRE